MGDNRWTSPDRHSGPDKYRQYWTIENRVYHFRKREVEWLPVETCPVVGRSCTAFGNVCGSKRFRKQIGFVPASWPKTAGQVSAGNLACQAAISG